MHPARAAVERELKRVHGVPGGIESQWIGGGWLVLCARVFIEEKFEGAKGQKLISLYNRGDNWARGLRKYRRIGTICEAILVGHSCTLLVVSVPEATYSVTGGTFGTLYTVNRVSRHAVQIPRGRLLPGWIDVDIQVVNKFPSLLAEERDSVINVWRRVMTLSLFP